MNEIKTYDEMNKQICGLLRFNGDNVSLYAAWRITGLETENAELKAMLDKAVILPCKVGDKIYIIINSCSNCPHHQPVKYKSGKYKGQFKGYYRCEALETEYFTSNSTNFECKNGVYKIIEVEFDLTNYFFDGFCVNNYYKNYNKTWFTDRTKAEARLAELKGGEQE